jgi:hypothetical protein
MKNEKWIECFFVCITLCLFFVPYITAGDKIDKFLSEAASVEILTRNVNNIFMSLGVDPELKSIDETAKGKTVGNIMLELDKKVPENFSAFQLFVSNIANHKAVSSERINIHKYCLSLVEDKSINKRLLADIIYQYLVNYIQHMLINAYCGKHESLSSAQLLALNNLILYMCPCGQAPTAKRIALIIQCLNDAQKRFKPYENIVITALNTGSLFMESLLTFALQHEGYKSLTINIIDQAYRTIGGERLQKYGLEKLFVIRKFGKQTGLALNFCLNGAKDCAKVGMINIFSESTDYIANCSKAKLKSHIMTAVDASWGGVATHFGHPFRGQGSLKLRKGINRADISYIDGDITFDVTVYMPRFGNPRIYWDRLLFLDLLKEKVLMQDATENTKGLDALKEGDIDNFRTKIVDNIVYTLVSDVVGQERLNKMYERLTRRLKEKNPSDSRKEDEDIAIGERFSQSVNDITKNYVKVDYKRDPYILLQELIIACGQPNGLAYMIGAGKLIRCDQKIIRTLGGCYSPFEKYGDTERRCILRSAEFVEQQIFNE